MKRIWLLTVLASLAVLCPAPVNVQPPEGFKALPMQQSDEKLKQEQAEQSVQGVVGRVEQKTENVTIDPTQTSSGASDTLRTANATVGAEVVSEASKEMKGTKSSAGSLWIWAVVVLSVGFGVLFVAKNWADRHIPDPSTANKKITW
jgi:hypothetical protein